MSERDGDEDWMWAEACRMLMQAERMHRHSFVPRHPASALPVWHPPADVLETGREVLILAAVEAAIEDGALRVAGRRLLPPELRNAAIHRLELPQGRFERRIPLPPGRYAAPVRHSLVNGCLLVRLEKAG